MIKLNKVDLYDKIPSKVKDHVMKLKPDFVEIDDKGLSNADIEKLIRHFERMGYQLDKEIN